MRNELVLVLIIVAALALWFFGRPKDEVVPPKCPSICAYGCAPGSTACRPPPPPSCPSTCTLGCIQGTSQCLEMPKHKSIIQCSAVNENSEVDMNINSEDTCLLIEGDDVTLDCNDNVITGSRNQDSYAIYIKGRKNVSIRNCVLRNYGIGIVVESSSDVSISNVRMEKNDVGILVNLSSSITLDRMTASKNIVAGAMLVSSSKVDFSNNDISDNPAGVIIESSNISRLFNNNICSSISIACNNAEVTREGENMCDKELDCGVKCLPCEKPST